MPLIPLMPAMPLIALPFPADERLPVEPFGEDGMFIFMSPVMPGIDDIPCAPDIPFMPGIDDIPFAPDIPVMPDMSARVGRATAGPIPGIPAMLFALDALPFAFDVPGIDPIPGMSAIPLPTDVSAATVPPLVLVFRLPEGEREESIPAIPGMLAIDLALSTAEA
ncbi:hypothetical protein BH11GEM2_BH11GEM2_22340 [soil metagenome]